MQTTLYDDLFALSIDDISKFIDMSDQHINKARFIASMDKNKDTQESMNKVIEYNIDQIKLYNSILTYKSKYLSISS